MKYEVVATRTRESTKHKDKFLKKFLKRKCINVQNSLLGFKSFLCLVQWRKESFHEHWVHLMPCKFWTRRNSVSLGDYSQITRPRFPSRKAWVTSTSYRHRRSCMQCWTRLAYIKNPLVYKGGIDPMTSFLIPLFHAIRRPMQESS